MNLGTFKWKASGILIVLVASVWFNVNSTWGILFLFWVGHAISSGQLVLGDDLIREEDTLLFWIACLFFLSLCLWLIVVDFIFLLEHLL